MTTPRFCLLLLLAFTWALSGCAAGSRTLVPQPPPAEPGVEVQSWTQANRSGAQKALFLRNLTDRRIQVYALTLYGCTNVVGTCGTSDPSVRLEPGESVALATLRRLDRAQSYSFQYTYRWRHEQD